MACKSSKTLRLLGLTGQREETVLPVSRCPVRSGSDQPGEMWSCRITNTASNTLLKEIEGRKKKPFDLSYIPNSKLLFFFFFFPLVKPNWRPASMKALVLEYTKIKLPGHKLGQKRMKNGSGREKTQHMPFFSRVITRVER